MELEFSTHENADVVAVSGSIDALTAAELTDFLKSKINEGNPCLVLDLSGVDFMSSAGLRALLATLKESRGRGCDLRLAAIQPGTERVLKMSGFLRNIQSFPDVESALESFDA